MINISSLMSKMLKLSRALEVEFNSVLRRFFIDELVFTIANSHYGNEFVFKGGVILSNIFGLDNRQTIDMDATHLGNSKEEMIKKLQLALLEPSPHGVTFGIDGTPRDIINEEGLRFKVICHLENMREPFYIDIAPQKPNISMHHQYDYKAIYDGKTANVLIDRLEKVLAEKFDAIVWHQTSSSRIKDYFDIFCAIKNRDVILSFDDQAVYDSCVEVFKSSNRKDRKTKENIPPRPFDPEDIKMVVSNIREIEKAREKLSTFLNHKNFSEFTVDNVFDTIYDFANSLIDIKQKMANNRTPSPTTPQSTASNRHLRP